MNKIDFPLGVELPLRGGGVAVLYEFFEGRWYGRCRDKCATTWEPWMSGCWIANGDHLHGESSPWSILAPKRKAWVVWFKHRPPSLFHVNPDHVWIEEEDEDGPPEVGVIQEITEP